MGISMISVLLCVKNGGPFIAETIESVLNQTYKNFELIIIVNCSTDNTLQVIKQFEDQRIRVYETNIGQLSFNLNLALSKSKGEYIARIDADDIAMPERFEKQLRVLEDHNYDIVGSNLEYINGKGVVIGQRVLPEDNVTIRNKIYYKSVLAHPTIFARKSVLLDNNGYLGGRFAQDYDLWLRVMRDKNIKFHNIQEPLLQYRIHSDQSKGNPYSFAEVAGYLFKESIYSKSLKYFIGSFVYYLKALLK